MADEQGIHPEVMRQIMDLHRKHSELQMQMHDKGDGEPHEVFQQLLTVLEKLNANIEKLIQAVGTDAQADKGETKEGNSGKRRERAGASAASGEASTEA